MKKIILFLSSLIVLSLFSCQQKKIQVSKDEMLFRADATLSSLFTNYGVQNTNLLRENYPFNNNYTVTYLASDNENNVTNLYSYLWPYSGILSAVNSLIYATGDDKYTTLMESKVLPGLNHYLDTVRTPFAYSSYINSATESDRFYDDNIWIGIDFVELYNVCRKQEYLKKATAIWNFVESGTDEQLGGGVYWCEQQKVGKNTCSNAPAVVYALKLFGATGDSTYFTQAKNIYAWTKQNLQDKNDYLYYDHITLDGKVGEAKFAYNSGQMLQASAMLYNLTHDKKYLTEAQNIAESCYNYFFQDYEKSQHETLRLLKKGDVWFSAVMFRGFVELYNIDKNGKYIEAFKRSLDYAWENSRDENGLFSTDWTGATQDSTKWLLTQAAMTEMYSRMSTIQITE